MSSDEISGLPEEQRLSIWDHLIRIAANHRRFADAKWALSDELLTLIESVAAKLAPSNPFNLYQHLFSDRDFDYYDENENWEEQQQKLDKRRDAAIEEIFSQGGIDVVIHFAESVLSPFQVGYALGSMADSSIEQTLLPAFLDSEDQKHSKLVSGFVWRRHFRNGWSWSDELDKSPWSKKQIGCFLSYLPFAMESWERAGLWLGDSQGEYWSRTSANSYQADGNLDIAIGKLIEYGRPRAAINCLDRMRHAKQPIKVDQCIRALLDSLSSKEPAYATDGHHIVELIKYLQANSEISPDDLFRVEWAYLPLLDRHRGASPKLLEKRLANDPEFFCEVIQLIYRSKKSDVPRDEPTEDLETIATNAWRLLYEWQTPPGMQEDGGFNNANFYSWLQRVKEICIESGHLEVALTNIGEVLIHSPADPDGLWINRTVADALNDRDSEDMREGYRTGTYNSRGVHCVDPTGKPERDLAQQYRQRAEDVENAGFQRLAVTLKKLADSYDREAERVISDHKQEVLE